MRRGALPTSLLCFPAHSGTVMMTTTIFIHSSSLGKETIIDELGRRTITRLRHPQVGKHVLPRLPARFDIGAEEARTHIITTRPNSIVCYRFRPLHHFSLSLLAAGCGFRRALSTCWQTATKFSFFSILLLFLSALSSFSGSSSLAS